MKKDKLQQSADKFLSQYDNQELRGKMVQDVNEGNERVINNNKRTWIITVSTVLLILILAFGTYMLLRKTPEKHYSVENQIPCDVTVDEISLKIPDLNIDATNASICQRVDDKYYNETLYYRVKFTSADDTQNFDLIIVTNPEYQYPFSDKKYDRQYTPLNMQYTEHCVFESGIYAFNCLGEFTVNGVKLYINYEGLELENKSNFTNFLDQCLSIKQTH